MVFLQVPVKILVWFCENMLCHVLGQIGLYIEFFFGGGGSKVVEGFLSISHLLFVKSIIILKQECQNRILHQLYLKYFFQYSIWMFKNHNFFWNWVRDSYWYPRNTLISGPVLRYSKLLSIKNYCKIICTFLKIAPEQSLKIIQLTCIL